MKRKEWCVLPALCVVITSSLILPVSAVNNQGLYWGTSNGARYDFTYSYREYLGSNSSELSDMIQYDYYVLIDGLPDIPDDYSLYTVLYPESVQYFYANGTVIPYAAYMLQFTVLPVGNWTAYEGYIESTPSMYNTTLIDDASEWGMEMSTDDTVFEHISGVTVLKSDGVIYRYWDMVRASDSGQEYTSVNITRLATASPLVFGGIAAGAVIIAIIGIEYCRRQKQSRS